MTVASDELLVRVTGYSTHHEVEGEMTVEGLDTEHDLILNNLLSQEPIQSLESKNSRLQGKV